MSNQIAPPPNILLMKKNILVIDDDATFIAAMEGVLNKEHYEMTSAHDGTTGLEAIKKHKPDLILLDIRMPGMNGIEFLKELNDTYGKGAIPIIITSNVSELDIVSEGISLGVRGYFMKSNESLENIVKIVDDAFGKRTEN